MPRLLLVEDNEMNRDMLSRRLARVGHEALIAETATMGIVMARNASPDLVLMDIHLGENDAKAFVDNIRKNEHLQFTKIVAMSGKLTDGQAHGLRSQGYHGFLRKPFQVRQVVEAIEQATNVAA